MLPPSGVCSAHEKGLQNGKWFCSLTNAGMLHTHKAGSWALWGLFFRAFCGAVFSLGPWLFPPFCSFLLCYWGLRSSEPWGCLRFLLLLFLPFLFVDIETFLNTEHDLALLHMSIYIAERWHRAHGLVCTGVVRPHL